MSREAAGLGLINVLIRDLREAAISGQALYNSQPLASQETLQRLSEFKYVNGGAGRSYNISGTSLVGTDDSRKEFLPQSKSEEKEEMKRASVTVEFTDQHQK